MSARASAPRSRRRMRRARYWKPPSQSTRARNPARVCGGCRWHGRRVPSPAQCRPSIPRKGRTVRARGGWPATCSPPRHGRSGRHYAMRLATQIGTAAMLSLLGIVLSARPADAGCGCDKPPPPLAQVRPNVAYAGAPVSLFGPSLNVGDAYVVTFASGVAPASTVTMTTAVVNLRDLGDGAYKPQLVVAVPSLPLGPASITATPVAGNAPAIAIPDSSFTVAPMPMAVPTGLAEYHFPNYPAAVGCAGVVYLSLDLTNVQQPMVFEAQPRGYAMRFGGDDVVFYNVQGFLMQRLMQTGQN